MSATVRIDRKLTAALAGCGLRLCRALWWLLPGLVALRATAGDVIINEINYQPKSGRPSEEWIEIYHRGTTVLNLAGWRFTRGVEFEFPSRLLNPGEYLVVCADTNAFAKLYPGVATLGNWTGSLSDHGEEIRLEDSENHKSDSVRYASQGDWSQRWRATNNGWVWAALPNGLGGTIERVGINSDSNLGQNWAPSNVPNGTPGGANSAGQSNVAPFILGVKHHPAVPRSTNVVTITATVRDDEAAALSVFLFYRLDGVESFSQMPMFDDGAHGDGAAGDSVFGAQLPAQKNGAVVEFYVQASDERIARTWPQIAYGSGQQLANCLYQVDDEPESDLPRYRLVVTAAEREFLRQIDQLPWYLPSSAQVNATFVCTENGATDIRYRCGVRQRGTTSRDADPPSRRVTFPNDDTWRGFRAINLNGIRPHSQVVGAALARLSGVPAARSRLVEVRENGVARSGPGTPVAGLYAHNEEVNGDFCDTAFPGDGGGNLYGTSSYADLRYLGESATNYSALYYYTKETNEGFDDWSDLIGLTRAINQSSDSEFHDAVLAVADPTEWARYFAFNYLIGNTESCLANPSLREGVWNTGDYLLYRGQRDPRFRLVAYDFDSVLGTEGGDVAGPYTAANLTAIARFLRDPDFGGRFHAELRRLQATVLSPESVSAVIDRLLAPHIPENLRASMKAFAAARPARLAGAIPNGLAITNSVKLTNGAVIVLADRFTLGGRADPATTRWVNVRGVPVAVDGLTGNWALELPLDPGMNRVEVVALDASGGRVTHLLYNLWREGPAGGTASGVLAADAVWRAAQSPIVLLDNLVVPAGRTLTIEPGTTVSVATGKGIEVRGRVIAEGTPSRRIYLGISPVFSTQWRGFAFIDAGVESRLVNVDIGQASPSPLWLTNSVATFEGITFPNHNGNALLAYYSSLLVRGCTFPSVTFGEPVGVLGGRAGGRMRFEGNLFGSTVGYADVVEASLLKRPGPILEIIDNVFIGGGDDGLDLDGCDAHIEGNFFGHFHKDAFNQNTSISSAIAVGLYTHGETSDLTVVRNTFFENDYDFEFKELATIDSRNNTFVGGRIGSVAFAEPERSGEVPGKSALFNGCIWWNYATPMIHADTNLIANGTVTVRVDNSILAQDGPWMGVNNSTGDPRFVNATNNWHLLAGSPALDRVGPGLNAGSMVPAGPRLVERPAAKSDARHVAGRVVGAGIRQFRFVLDGAPPSPAQSLDVPLVLNNLSLGSHTLELYGLRIDGAWLDTPSDIIRWETVPPFAAVEISEVLANNSGLVTLGGVATDLIELHNRGSLAADLSDMSLSDDPARPRQFIFPKGAVLPAGGYLTIFADKNLVPAGFHLGSGLDADGDGVFLYAPSLQNNVMLDSVRFGPQLAGWSIGRQPDGVWTLCRPTFGSANQPTPLGNPAGLRINEFLANNGPLSSGDFVELYNPDPLPVALDGLALSTSPVVSSEHPLPSLGFVPGGGFIVMRKDAVGSTIALSREFGTVALLDPQGHALDSIAYATQSEDVSEGRLPDGLGPVIRLASGSSPGYANLPAARPVRLSWTSVAAGGKPRLAVTGAVPGVRYSIQSSTTVAGPWVVGTIWTATAPEGQFDVDVGPGIRLYRVAWGE